MGNNGNPSRSGSNVVVNFTKTLGRWHLNSESIAQQGVQNLETKLYNGLNLFPVSIIKIRCVCADQRLLTPHLPTAKVKHQ